MGGGGGGRAGGASEGVLGGISTAASCAVGGGGGGGGVGGFGGGVGCGSGIGSVAGAGSAWTASGCCGGGGGGGDGGRSWAGCSAGRGRPGIQAGRARAVGGSRFTILHSGKLYFCDEVRASLFILKKPSIISMYQIFKDWNERSLFLNFISQMQNWKARIAVWMNRLYFCLSFIRPRKKKLVPSLSLSNLSPVKNLSVKAECRFFVTRQSRNKCLKVSSGTSTGTVPGLAFIKRVC